jgi:glutathione peroxidase
LQKNYGVSFPMMSKVDVNGDKADPLFKWLCGEAPGLNKRPSNGTHQRFLDRPQWPVIERYAMDKPEAW